MNNRLIATLSAFLIPLFIIASAHANPTFQENQRVGTADWQLVNPALQREVEGYASLTSVNRGDAIDLFINTSAETVNIDIYRLGWYQGLGGRQIGSTVTVDGVVQTIPAPDADGLINCEWVSPYSLQTGSDWVSGVYLAKLTESTQQAQSYILFVVRDDERHPDLLFQLPVTTYQAYNFWGGKSTYGWGSGSALPWGSTHGQPATRVSFNRPYARSTNDAAGYGAGAGEFLTNIQPVAQGYPISSAGWDYNYLRWLEREGYDVAYMTNIDTHARPELITKSQAFLSIGHDEYWTYSMREHVENARDAGVNLAFFSANAVYWQVRFSSDPHTGASHRIMDIYKSGYHDPYAQDNDPSNDHLMTVRFRDLGRSEDALMGVRYFLDPVDADMIIANADHFLLNNTGLANGDKLPGLLGYEVDGRAGHEPANTETLAATPIGDNTAHMVTYEAASGARVFATGTMQWSWGLDDFGAPGLRTSRLNAAAQQITRNLFADFGANPVQLPEANNDYYAVATDQVLSVDAPGLLANDSANSTAAVATSTAGYGVLDLNANGAFIYTPNQGFQGMDTFSYVSSDGAQQSEQAQVSLYIDPILATHYWPMDGASLTSMINIMDPANSGAILGAERVTGQVGGGLSFDGVDDHITLNLQSLPAPWVASVWVKPHARTINSVILGSDQFALKLEQWPDTGNVGFTRYGVADYQFDYSAPLGSWTHLTFLNNGSETQLYVNCEYHSSRSSTVDLPLTVVGKKWIGGGQLPAELDELKIFDRSLSGSEIATLCYLPGAPVIDSDGDGVPDTEDAFPNDPTESVDSDDDGIGDNGDPYPSDPANGTAGLGLVHYWRMNDTSSGLLRDYVNSSETGSIEGAQSSSGVLLQGLLFDGLDDFVSLEQQSLTSPWTASVWVRREAMTNNAVILGDYQYAIKLEQWPDTGKVGFTRYGVEDYLFDYSAPIGVWTHLTFVSSGSETKLYVNCEYEAAHPNTIDLPLMVMGRKITGGGHIHAGLDEVKIFDQVLNEDQINLLCIR